MIYKRCMPLLNIWQVLLVLKKIITLFALLLCLLAVLWGAFVYHLNQPLKLSKETLITVTPGSSISSFSHQLKKKGWISTRFWLRNYVRVHTSLTSLKAGTYLIQPDTPLIALLQQVVSGAEHQFSITFVEGTTLKQWLVQLKSHPHIKQTLTSNSQLVEYLDTEYQHLEGLFYPNTYAFTHNTPEKVLLKQAYQKMQSYLRTLWKSKANNLPYKNPYEALVMASIIEKESAQAQEYPIIASVFVNRLHKRMRLQTDPTVIYGLGERYQGDITKAHLKEKTPYNTYRIKGLPPTPIAMPGLGALEAALNPSTTEYFYFVSNGNGYHQFSKNLSDHNKAVRAYLKKQKGNKK